MLVWLKHSFIIKSFRVCALFFLQAPSQVDFILSPVRYIEATYFCWDPNSISRNKTSVHELSTVIWKLWNIQTSWLFHLMMQCPWSMLGQIQRTSKALVVQVAQWGMRPNSTFPVVWDSSGLESTNITRNGDTLSLIPNMWRKKQSNNFCWISVYIWWPLGTLYFYTCHTRCSLTDLGVTSADVAAEQRSGKPPRVKRAHANALEERDHVPTHRSTMHTDSRTDPIYITIYKTEWWTSWLICPPRITWPKINLCFFPALQLDAAELRICVYIWFLAAVLQLVEVQMYFQEVDRSGWRERSRGSL